VIVLCLAASALVAVPYTYAKIGNGVEFFPNVEPDYGLLYVKARGNLSIQEKDLLVRQAEDRILDILLPSARPVGFGASSSATDTADEGSTTRQTFRKRLREGLLDDKEIEIEVTSSAPQGGFEIPGMPGASVINIQDMLGKAFGGRGVKRKVKVKDAHAPLMAEEADKLLDQDALQKEAVTLVENHGIAFIDEIDKVANREGHGQGPSREGVQRDLLPLIEGSTITTKYGSVKTDHILFIASGAFHLSKPSDLIPELQGRLPIRVELSALTAHDFERILSEPCCSLTEQYQALLGTENLQVSFTQDGIAKIAEIAFQVNERTENIGARRLSTVMERLLDEVSFDAAKLGGQTVTVDAAYVNGRLGELSQDEDLSRYIL
jgi:ATP-dependent HslUV protease ATP-binding subunit HslU